MVSVDVKPHVSFQPTVRHSQSSYDRQTLDVTIDSVLYVSDRNPACAIFVRHKTLSDSERSQRVSAPIAAVLVCPTDALRQCLIVDARRTSEQVWGDRCLRHLHAYWINDLTAKPQGFQLKNASSQAVNKNLQNVYINAGFTCRSRFPFRGSLFGVTYTGWSPHSNFDVF